MEINQYIRNQLAAGYSGEQVKAAMLASGWDESQAARAIAQAQTATPNLPNVGPGVNKPAISLKPTMAKLGLLAVAVMLLIGAGIFWAIKTGPTTNVTPDDESAGLAAISDCGEVEVQDTATDYFNSCFNQAFHACKPAKLSYKVPESVELFGSTAGVYTIVGPTGQQCQVSWLYTRLPTNPTWENKEITCPYNNRLSFKNALEANSKYEGCSGPLYDEIFAQAGQSQTAPGIDVQTSE